MIDACIAKLEKYLFYNGMPSMKLLKAIRILDPLFFKMNNVDNNEYVKDFPELEFCVDEINNYKLLCRNLRETIEIKDFWSIYKKQLPKINDLAKVILHFPVGTASVERSFSKYNTLLADFA